MILISFITLYLNFMKTYFSNWQPYIAEKNKDKWKNLTLYPTEKGIFF